VGRFPVSDDDDDEIGVLYEPKIKPKKASKWIVIAAFFEMIADLFGAFHKFFDALEDESLARFRYERSRQDFQEQAALEIEMLTSGKYDATSTESGRGVGSGSTE
jgi:hypothetical protein